MGETFATLFYGALIFGGPIFMLACIVVFPIWNIVDKIIGED